MSLDYEKTMKNRDRFLKKYLAENMKNIEFSDCHMTRLKYLFETDKNKFIVNFIETFGRNALYSIFKEGKVSFPLLGTNYCFHCGEYIELSFDGKTISNNDGNLDCFHDKIYSFNIDIPSGKLLLNDWLTYGNELFGEDFENINCLYGRYKESKKYADKKIMHFYVGNTCPTVSQKDDLIIIESPGYNDENDEEIFYDESFSKKGNICTDLWWTTGIDLELYFDLLKKRFKKDISKDEKVLKTLKEGVIVDVTPGTYKCTTYYESLDDVSDKSQIFIKIEKI